MGQRDLLFAVLILGGIAVMGSSLAPPRSQSRSVAAALPISDDFQAVVDRVDRSFQVIRDDQGISSADKAADLAVLRRVTLGLAGSIPSLEEIRRFESLPADGRMDRWMVAMLQERRTVDYLAERLARSFVGVEDGPFLIFRRRKFVSWLSDELLKNRPYDQIVRDLIAGRGLWTDHPATNFITVTMDPETKKADPERLAARVARAFLGVRIDCAQCHDHPFQPWKRADFRGIAAYFGQVQSGFTGINDGKGDGEGEFLVDDKKDGKPVAITPKVPFLTQLDPMVGTRRERLGRWVTDPRNPNFARSATNRAWALMFGRPLVEPIDDLASVPQVPEALVILSEDFASHGYDLRRLFRLIASTEAFSAESTSKSELESESESESSTATEAAWAAFPLTRLRPEQVAGALLQSASAVTIDAESHILVRIATQGGVNDFVRRHGDPGEEEFGLEPSSTIPQRLLMMNGDLVESKIKGELGNLTTRISILAPDDRSAVEVAYLATLTRRPSPIEAAHFEARLAGTLGDDRKERVSDLVWTLLNATEFSWDH